MFNNFSSFETNRGRGVRILMDKINCTKRAVNKRKINGRKSLSLKNKNVTISNKQQKNKNKSERYSKFKPLNTHLKLILT